MVISCTKLQFSSLSWPCKHQFWRLQIPLSSSDGTRRERPLLKEKNASLLKEKPMSSVKVLQSILPTAFQTTWTLFAPAFSTAQSSHRQFLPLCSVQLSIIGLVNTCYSESTKCQKCSPDSWPNSSQTWCLLSSLFGPSLSNTSSWAQKVLIWKTIWLKKKSSSKRSLILRKLLSASL